MQVYVATSGEYSDYHVVGVYSTYAAAGRAGDRVFVTTIDDPDDTSVGCWECIMVEDKTTANDSAPSGKYPDNRRLHPGDVVSLEWNPGVPVEMPPNEGYPKTIIARGHSKEAAVRAAQQYINVRKTLPWFANAWWPDSVYREPPTEPYIETAWATIDRRPGAVQAVGATEEEARAAAIALAGHPSYDHQFSSNTTAGLLPVWVRAGAKVQPY